VAPGLRWVIPLAEAAEGDEPCIDGKVANLAQLAQAGFHVPDGFFVTTHAFEHFVE
jgi:phosphoenolpyruvate synthase/pyruvate phosphate dikinase